MLDMDGYFVFYCHLSFLIARYDDEHFNYVTTKMRST